jgi:hypothetical protein
VGSSIQLPSQRQVGTILTIRRASPFPLAHCLVQIVYRNTLQSSLSKNRAIFSQYSTTLISLLFHHLQCCVAGRPRKQAYSKPDLGGGVLKRESILMIQSLTRFFSRIYAQRECFKSASYYADETSARRLVRNQYGKSLKLLDLAFATSFPYGP